MSRATRLISTLVAGLVLLLGYFATAGGHIKEINRIYPDTMYMRYNWVPANRFALIASRKDPGARLYVRVPAKWSDVETHRTMHFGSTRNEVGPAILASGNAQEWADSYGIPGIFLGASKSIASEPFHVILKTKSIAAASGCGKGSRLLRDFSERPGYVIKYWIWDHCGGKKGQRFVVFAAKPESGRQLVVVGQMQLEHKDDWEAFTTALKTFEVNMDRWPKRFI